MKMKTSIMIVFTLIMFVYGSEAFKCYECEGKSKDDACKTKPKDITKKRDCEADQLCLTMEANGLDGPNSYTFVRGCGGVKQISVYVDDYKTLVAGCKTISMKDAKGGDISGDVCPCKGELCNGPQSPHSGDSQKNYSVSQKISLFALLIACAVSAVNLY